MNSKFYLCILALAAILFSCNGGTTTTAAADSTGAAATDSTSTAAAQPAPADQSSSSTSSQDDASSSSTAAAADGQPTTPVTTQQFQTELSPDGSWVNDPGEGQVWQPNVAADFVPYSTSGHWVYTNAGWTWASDYKWGWATFHYGAWFQNNNHKWLWKPGTKWAPAQVKWAQSGTYYGWAPLAPSISITANWTPPAASWTFVNKQNIIQPEINKYVVPRATNVTIVKQVTVINNVYNNKTVINNNKTTINTVYNKGPQITDVEKVTNKKIVQVNINYNNKQVGSKVTNNTLVIYHPTVVNKTVVNKTVQQNKVVEQKKVVVEKKPEPKPVEQGKPKPPVKKKEVH